MKDALEALRPRLLAGRDAKIQIIDHGSKQKLMRDLPKRFAGYVQRIVREDLRILVVVDRDDADCRTLKDGLERIAAAAGLPTKSAPAADGRFRVVNRIVVEELEAWYFGDIPALCAAYPGVPGTLARKQRYRHPDAITGGTWERLLRVLQEAGYYSGTDRLPKSVVARKVAALMEPDRNTSPSFRHFVIGLEALLI